MRFVCRGLRDRDGAKWRGEDAAQRDGGEGRRMVSAYVMTQANCQSTTTVKDSVGLASYHMDSHFCQRVVEERDGKKTVRNEGGFGKGCPKPFPIAYRSIVPKREECQNLIVPGCLSASHVAYGSIRMEPVFMILGQSAGTAAALAIDEGTTVQDLNYSTLKATLEKNGQRLEWFKERSAEPAKQLSGLVTDDSAARTTGVWSSGTLSAVCGAAYLHDGNDGKSPSNVSIGVVCLDSRFHPLPVLPVQPDRLQSSRCRVPYAF